MRRKKIFYSVLAVIVLLGGLFFYYRYCELQRHTFHVTFLNIGQGDSALINFSDGTTMLIDCGPDRTVLSELGKALPFYVRTLDIVLATHPDRDHYGGCADVVRQYHVKKIVTNGRTKPGDATWQNWDSAQHESGAELITMAAPTVWTIASDTLQFFSPDPSLPMSTPADDSNNYSIVFKLTHSVSPLPRSYSAGFIFLADSPRLGGSVGLQKMNTPRDNLAEINSANIPGAESETFMFTGDMERPLEDALIKKYCGTGSDCPALQADILKVGHHGSKSSTSQEFVNVVQSTSAIVSVGKNSYGHPSVRVLKRLERAGASVLRTDTAGAIVVW